MATKKFNAMTEIRLLNIAEKNGDYKMALFLCVGIAKHFFGKVLQIETLQKIQMIEFAAHNLAVKKKPCAKK